MHLEEGDGTLGSKSLFGTYSQAWVKNQCFSLNRETADRCAVFTSGYLEIQLHLATQLFLYLLGEGISAFIVLVFLSSWGRMLRSHSQRCQARFGGWTVIFLNLGELAER